MNHFERLQGKICLITGGGRGLGEAICRSLASSGATVYVADVKSDAAEEVAQSIRKTSGQARSLSLDVTDPARIEMAMLQILGDSGKLDVVVNNAGVDKTVPIEEMEITDWDRILRTNLTGPFLIAKRAIPLMREQGRGHIVNIVSTAAKRAWPNASAYHASKWGLLGFSHALHTEARESNIKVTSVICGGMRTPFLLERFPDIDLRNLQDPNSVAETIKFVLCAPEETVIPELLALPMRETSWP